MASEGPTSRTRLRSSLLSKRPDQEELPGEGEEKRQQPLSGWSAAQTWASSAANVLIPVGVHALNFAEWGQLAAAAWYCLPKFALVVFKLAAVAWQSRHHGLVPEAKNIDLDKGAYKFALYAARVAVDAAVAPLWYHFLGESLFSLTPTSVLAGLGVGLAAWLVWLLVPSFLFEFRTRYPEAWSPISFYRPGLKAYGLIAIRLAHSSTLNAIVDELYFRGFLARWLARSLSESPADTFTGVALTELYLPAALLTAVLYSTSRTRTAAEVPFWACFWLVNNALTVTFGCLGPACIASGSFNLLVGLWIVTQGEWHLW